MGSSVSYDKMAKRPSSPPSHQIRARWAPDGQTELGRSLCLRLRLRVFGWGCYLGTGPVRPTTDAPHPRGKSPVSQGGWQGGCWGRRSPRGWGQEILLILPSWPLQSPTPTAQRAPRLGSLTASPEGRSPFPQWPRPWLPRARGKSGLDG